MGWIAETHMVDVHLLRQDYARALAARAADPSPMNEALLYEVEERRDRAVRSLHRDDEMSVKHLAGMFRCSKTTIRDILAADTEGMTS